MIITLSTSSIHFPGSSLPHINTTNHIAPNPNSSWNEKGPRKEKEKRNTGRACS